MPTPGEWLRSARELCGFSSGAEFARALGVDASLVSRYERDKVPIDIARAREIATTLRMDEAVVLQGLGLGVKSQAASRHPDPVLAEINDGLEGDPELAQAVLAIIRRAVQSRVDGGDTETRPTRRDGEETVETG